MDLSTEINILKDNIKELQKQLAQAHQRIGELVSEKSASNEEVIKQKQFIQELTGELNRVNSETEKKIQDALSFLTKGKTTLVIAHRLSTVLNSHKIYVIDHGEVVAEGNHKELLNNSPVYKNFYDKQIQKD